MTSIKTFWKFRTLKGKNSYPFFMLFPYGIQFPIAKTNKNVKNYRKSYKKGKKKR